MTELLIDGEWVAAQGAGTHELIDPTNRKIAAAIRFASEEQREAAFCAARSASAEWASRVDRGALVQALVEELRQSAGALAQRQAIESGQPLRECQDQAAWALRRLRSLDVEPLQPAAVREHRLQRHGLWPFWENTLRRIAAGCAIVCVLPADLALASLAVARCVQRLPRGVLNVITVAPGEMVQERVASDFVFVGSDANLDVAIAGAAVLRLYNTGQRIGQSVRVHVDGAIAYGFADRLHEYLAFLECGDPTKPATDLGPLCSDAALQAAVEQIGLALKHGALVKLGGRAYQPWGLRGYFLQPTLLVEGVGEERVPYECAAAPVIIVSPTNDIGTVVRDSAGTPGSALRVSAFTADMSRVKDSLRAAGFRVNTQPYTPLVERVGEPVGPSALALEVIQEPQADWFPYKSRRGLKL